MRAMLRTGIVILLCLLVGLAACSDATGRGDDGEGGCYKTAEDRSESGVDKR